ncbi:MAG: nucleotide exchange factor GrpE [Candidatus Moranbacteria bacterium]|nr:nucleotide exchange factor GrpE [Candidatus Moranbacteria bacterium]
MVKGGDSFARTVLTIKVAIIRDNKEVLLLKRSKKSLNSGKWDLPGGHLDKGETIREAIIREVQEETGLEIEVGEILGTTEFSKEAKQFKEEKRGLRYLAYYKSGEVKISGEHQDHKWLSFEKAFKKLSEKDGFEQEKRVVIQKAQKVLEAESALLGWKRALADLENYKKRAAKENADFKRYCLEDYIFDLFPVLDNFELALKHVPEEEASNNWIVGILHIKKQLENVLNENGVSVIETKVGDDFDENIHEVIEGKVKKGKVKEIAKVGYKIGGRIIRPAVIRVN